MPLLPPPELGFGGPPPDVQALLEGLEETLDSELPAKRAGENVLIATWNIQALSRATKRWVAAETDDPKRNLQDLCCIATIISRFDVVAVVEIKRNLEALRLLMAILGPGWGFIVSDVSAGEEGNDERLGYLFDLERAKPSGLAGELVIPDEELDQDQAVLDEQFDRTPYAVSFGAGDQAFTLISLHIKYGKSDEPELRTPELAGFAAWMRDHADDEDEFNRNLIALGDFNIDRQGIPTGTRS